MTTVQEVAAIAEGLGAKVEQARANKISRSTFPGLKAAAPRVPPTGESVEDFIKNFSRDADGAWICIRKAEFNGPNGRIQVTVGSRFTRGTNFMGVDLAEWLDEQRRKEDGQR